MRLEEAEHDDVIRFPIDAQYGIGSPKEFAECFIDTAAKVGTVYKSYSQIVPFLDPVDGRAVHTQLAARHWAFTKAEIFRFFGFNLISHMPQ